VTAINNVNNFVKKNNVNNRAWQLRSSCTTQRLVQVQRRQKKLIFTINKLTGGRAPPPSAVSEWNATHAARRRELSLATTNCCGVPRSRAFVVVGSGLSAAGRVESVSSPHWTWPAVRRVQRSACCMRAYCMCLSGQPVAVVETYVGARLSRLVQFNFSHLITRWPRQRFSKD
jgi:hypothetical protein